MLGNARSSRAGGNEKGTLLAAAAAAPGAGGGGAVVSRSCPRYPGHVPRTPIHVPRYPSHVPGIPVMSGIPDMSLGMPAMSPGITVMPLGIPVMSPSITVMSRGITVMSPVCRSCPRYHGHVPCRLLDAQRCESIVRTQADARPRALPHVMTMCMTPTWFRSRRARGVHARRRMSPRHHSPRNQGLVRMVPAGARPSCGRSCSEQGCLRASSPRIVPCR